ncbi:general substrate transporter [Aspergillus spinulosporus]
MIYILPKEIQASVLPTVRQLPREEAAMDCDRDIFHELSASIPSLQRLSSSARAATQAEQRLSFLEGCRLYPKAMMWSIVLSTTIVMAAYDTALIASFFTFPAFRKKYGEPVPSKPGTHEISSTWQASLTDGAVVGEILGLLVNGYLADYFGYRRTILGALALLSGFIFLEFFAVSTRMLLAAQVLCGIPWGIFQTLSTTYAADVIPVALRAYFLSSVNMCWLLGQLSAVGVARLLVTSDSEWAYRGPFAIQWALGVLVFIGVYFAPESPWWLIRKERPHEARRVLLKLTESRHGGVNVDGTVSMMQHTNEAEKFLGTSRMAYLDCFRGIDLRRTEITCMIWITQQASFSSSATYAAYFYEQAGLASHDALSLAAGMYGLAIVGGALSWFLMKRVGRRRLYLVGLATSMALLAITGGISFMPQTNAQAWAVGTLILVLTFVYDLSIGPLCYVLIAEIPSTRLRVKTVVLARIAYNVAALVTNIITPRMLNPTAWNWRGKSCFFFLGFSAICFVWCYWRLPETFGLSYLEIDILFEKKAKTSKFRELQRRLMTRGYFNIFSDSGDGAVW